jgi:hypothetical protein
MSTETEHPEGQAGTPAGEPEQKPASEPPAAQPASEKQRNGWRTFGIVVITMAVTLTVGYFVVTRYLFPTEFTPVTLNEREQQRLDRKLNRIGVQTDRSGALEPEPYSEADARREVFFTEREINAMLAHNTDLANKLAIDLSGNLASAKLLVDLDPEMPFFGGKTLKVTAGMEIRIDQHSPRAVLKGVSVWGVPLPNAWLGNMKNINLLTEFGEAGGFWQAIRDGVEEVEITEGKLRVKLKP